jgi:lysophospholipase L1-like esterase
MSTPVIVVLVILVLLVVSSISEVFIFSWKHIIGPINKSSMERCKKHNEGKPKGEIVFYGASNFTYWEMMEQDMLPYKVQNHGFGGSSDKDLMENADVLLYPYEPSVIVFQSGSNDFAIQGLSFDGVVKNKDKMYSEFHKKLPNAKFLVLSMLPLPNRQKFWPMSVKINAFLKEYCATHENMVYADATPVMMTPGGGFNKEIYRDGVHLNDKGRALWVPIIKSGLEQLGVRP